MPNRMGLFGLNTVSRRMSRGFQGNSTKRFQHNSVLNKLKQFKPENQQQVPNNPLSKTGPSDRSVFNRLNWVRKDPLKSTESRFIGQEYVRPAMPQTPTIPQPQSNAGSFRGGAGYSGTGAWSGGSSINYKLWGAATFAGITGVGLLYNKAESSSSQNHATEISTLAQDVLIKVSKLDKSISQVGNDLSKVKEMVDAQENKEIKDSQGPKWPLSFDYIKGLVDLTLLSPQATEQDIRDLCQKAMDNKAAGICVNPYRAAIARKILDEAQADTSHKVRLVSVVGCFPLAQSPLEVKLAEAKAVLKAGVDEIDMVLNLGAFLEGDEKTCREEITRIKSLAQKEGVILKVILETSNLHNSEQIRNASCLAVESGADFIKTSTGFGQSGASIEAVKIMADVIADHYYKTGILVGLKPSGGIRTPESVREMAEIVTDKLPLNFIKPETFRIGASSLMDAKEGASKGTY